MIYVPASLVSSIMLSIVELNRALDGQIYNPVTGKWEPATPASIAAANTAIDQSVAAVADLFPFPLVLSFGTIERNAVDTVMAKIRAALRTYAQATTKTGN